MVGPVLRSPMVRMVNARPVFLEIRVPELLNMIPIVAACVLPDREDDEFLELCLELDVGARIEDKSLLDIDARMAVVWNVKGAKMSTKSTLET